MGIPTAINKRLREAAARHEVEARRLGIDPGGMAGAARLVQRAEALGRHELPEAVRRTVQAWTLDTEPPALETVHRVRPDHEEAGRRIEAFLRDCRHCLNAAEALDPRIDGAEKLRREGLRLLGEGEGAKLDDPARVRLSRAADERQRVREAVDALGEEVQGLRSRAFMELSRSVDRQGLERAPIRSTCRHGGPCGFAPRRSGARRASHRKRGRRSMRCSPAMPAWRLRSLLSKLS